MKEKNKYKIIIVDDDLFFLKTLIIYLKKIGFSKIESANTFESGKALLGSQKPDLIILDIDLDSEHNGIELGEFSKEIHPKVPIIYFTNNFTQDYYISSIKTSPVAFMDKMLSELKVRQAVELALVALPQIDQEIEPVPSNEKKISDCIFIKVGRVFKQIIIADIEYIYYESRHSNIKIKDSSYPISIPLKDLAKKLPADVFIQIHQSYIVNKLKISKINTVHHELEINKKMLPLGVSFRKRVYDQLSFFH